jgi:hypothetical protein
VNCSQLPRCENSGKSLRPTIPFFSRGPDVLISAPGNICAIFVPTHAERRNAAHLAARLISTRLAYPQETRCILLRSEDNLERFFAHDFDAQISLRDPFANRRLASPEGGAKPAFSDQVREETVLRFDRALRASLLSYKWRSRFREGPPVRSEADQWRDLRSVLQRLTTADFREQTLRQRGRYSFRDVPVVIARSQSRSALLKRARSAAELQFVSDFGLDNGIPYRRSTADIAIFVSSHWGETFDENSKGVVASAFAGIAIAPSGDPDIVQTFIEKIPKLRRPSYRDDWWGDDEE